MRGGGRPLFLGPRRPLGTLWRRKGGMSRTYIYCALQQGQLHCCGRLAPATCMLESCCTQCLHLRGKGCFMDTSESLK